MIDWKQIVEQHGSLVWQTAQRLLRHEADAADCFQRTFVSALEFTRTKPNEPVRHWPAFLKRIATARAIEQLRKQIREKDRFKNETRTLNDLDQQIDADACNPDIAAAGSELAEHLRIALAEIDVRQAEVFCLASLEELSYQEIAEQLQITVNNVGVLLNRAKAALQKLLAAHDPKKLDRENTRI